jgi:hypothetical protein
MDVQVQGEEASGYRVYIHLPEDWVRKQNQDTLATTLHDRGLFGLIGAFVATIFVVFLRNLRRPSAAAVPWRRLARWTLPVLIAFMVWVFTNIPQYLSGYPTENSLSTYLSMTGVSLLLGSTAIYGLVFVLMGFAWFFLARTCGSDALPAWLGMPAAYYRDALIESICGLAILSGLARARDLLTRIWPVPHYGFQAVIPNALDGAPPALQTMARAVMFGLIALGVLALAAGFASSYLRETWKQVLLIGLLALLAAPRWGSTAELLQNTIVGWVALLLLWWAVRRVFRFNMLAYFLTAALLVLANAAAELLRQPNSYFHANGAVLLAAALALLLWPFLAWRRAGTHVPAGASGGDSPMLA